MIYIVAKALISGIIIAVVSEVAKRNPTFGALIASLPLVSLLGMIWLWRDTGDTRLLAQHSEATLWYVLPSLPMFAVMPLMLRAGIGFWPTLAAGISLTTLLYLLTSAILGRLGIAI